MFQKFRCFFSCASTLSSGLVVVLTSTFATAQVQQSSGTQDVLSELISATEIEITQIPPVSQSSFQMEPETQPKQLQPASAIQPQPSPPTAHVARLVANPIATRPERMPKVYTLKNLTMLQFESAIEATWGQAIESSTTADGRYLRVSLPNRVGKSMGMMIDRSTKSLIYEGDAELHDNWQQIIAQLDRPSLNSASKIALVHPGKADPSLVRQTVALLGVFQTSQDDEQTDGQERLQLPPGTPVPQLDEILPGGQGPAQGLQDRVKIVIDEETGVVTIIANNKKDLEIVQKMIEQLAAESAAAQPIVVRIPLSNIQSGSIVEQIQELYDNSYAASKGNAQVTAITSPNALIVVAQAGGIDVIRRIIAEMDVAPPEDSKGFRSFRLKYISAADAKVRLDAFFGQLSQEGSETQPPSAPVTTITDFRSNTITVKGAQQFIIEAERFLKELDVVDTSAANIVKIIPLKNTLAEDMAIVIQDAISGQQPNAGDGFNPNQQTQQQTANQSSDINPQESHLRSTALTLKAVGKDGKHITSSILFDVRVTVDRNSNSLVISAPEESMELIEELIRQLDRVPDATTQIKVFQIFNGDAETLLAMLETLFQADANQQNQQQGANLSQLPLQFDSATEGATLINLRFSVDTRTNSIIASGPAGDLQVVEDLLNRLDEREINERQVVVHRLSNAPVLDVADAINTWLDSRAAVIDEDPRAVGGVNQTNREVIVVPEVVSNSLIIQARTEYLAEISQIVQALDRRPPMVKVKVLIAEVDLNRLEEFGIDVGVQDSLLFDRGTSVAADGSITDGIGFPFNTSTIANTNATFQETLASQALSNLATGRINSELGYGGLVLSAGNESISVLMRALQDKQCVRVLSKPHIMTIENLQGRISIGAEVPRVSGTTNTNFGVTQDIDFVDVGVILEVTPRVSPDGMIVMAVNAVKSSVGPEELGITIAIGADGTPIRSPQINETEANTTLMARSGQTVVFSGLIQEEKAHTQRGTPILSDLPVIGPLFKFESDSASRSELLIIMTPYLITDDHSLDVQNFDEMDRMHWCLSDVAEVYGNTNYDGYQGIKTAVETYYPDLDPAGLNPQHHQAPAEIVPNYQEPQYP